jgi:hypothetical protein
MDLSLMQYLLLEPSSCFRNSIGRMYVYLKHAGKLLSFAQSLSAFSLLALRCSLVKEILPFRFCKLKSRGKEVNIFQAILFSLPCYVYTLEVHSK